MSTYEELEQELSASRARVIELRTEIDDTKQEHQRLQGIYNGAIERIHYLEEHLAQIRERLGVIRLVDVSALPTFAGEVANMVIAGNAAQKELKHVKASRLDLENALSNAEGLHARCEEEKKHLEANQLRGDYADLQERYGELDAKYQALVKEVAAIEAQPVTDTEAELREALDKATHEDRIARYALSYLMGLYDRECDRIQDLLNIQQDLKAALEDTTATLEDAQRAARNVKIIDDAIKEAEDTERTEKDGKNRRNAIEEYLGADALWGGKAHERTEKNSEVAPRSAG